LTVLAGSGALPVTPFTPFVTVPVTLLTVFTALFTGAGAPGTAGTARLGTWGTLTPTSTPATEMAPALVAPAQVAASAMTRAVALRVEGHTRTPE
jgi:hypothetical protein